MRTLLLLALLAVSAHARVGERWADALKRLGKPVESSVDRALGGDAHFKFGDSLLAVTVADGVICLEVFSHVTEKEMGVLLKAQTTFKWTTQPADAKTGEPGGTIKKWKTTSGLEAMYDGETLLVTDAAGRRLLKEREKERPRAGAGDPDDIKSRFRLR